MRNWLSLILFLSTINGFGQDTNSYPNPLSALRLRPSIRFSYEPHGYLHMNRFNFEIGVNDKERLFLFFGTGYETTMPQKFSDRRYDYFTNSFSLDVRILKAKYRFSPMLHFDRGWGYKSDSVPISGYYRPTNYTDFDHDYIGYFNKVSSFGAMQLKLDMLFQRLHFQTGVGLFFNKISYYLAKQNFKLIETRSIGGMVFSVSLVYDFN